MFEGNRSTNRAQDFMLLVSRLGQFLSCVHVHSFSELKRRNEDLCLTTCSVKTEICRKRNSNIQKIPLSLRRADPGAKTADEPWFTQYMIRIYYSKKHTHLFNIWHLFTLEFSSISLLCIQRCDLHSPTKLKSFLGRVSVESSLDDVRLKSVKVTKTRTSTFHQLSADSEQTGKTEHGAVWGNKQTNNNNNSNKSINQRQQTNLPENDSDWMIELEAKDELVNIGATNQEIKPKHPNKMTIKIKQEIIDVKAEKGGRTTTKKHEIKTRVWKTSLHRKARSDNRKLLSSQETQPIRALCVIITPENQKPMRSNRGRGFKSERVRPGLGSDAATSPARGWKWLN